jgi:hypothetical protein
VTNEHTSFHDCEAIEGLDIQKEVTDEHTSFHDCETLWGLKSINGFKEIVVVMLV